MISGVWFDGLRGGHNLLNHSTLAVVVNVISCVFVSCVPWLPDGACYSFGGVLAYASNGSWGISVNPGSVGSIHDSLLQPQTYSGT